MLADEEIIPPAGTVLVVRVEPAVTLKQTSATGVRRAGKQEIGPSDSRAGG